MTQLGPVRCQIAKMCPTRPLLLSRPTLRILELEYCARDWDQCARLSHEQESQPLPVNVLPTGETWTDSQAPK